MGLKTSGYLACKLAYEDEKDLFSRHHDFPFGCMQPSSTDHLGHRGH
jgi:hypothetical protein